MDKRVITAMFKNICDKNEIRPVMNGVCFDEEKPVCYGSDGHVLVIYKESDPRFKGKIMAENGEEIEGKYPNVYACFPDEKKGEFTEFTVDADQLRKACQWHSRNIDANEHDAVVINGIGFNIRYLLRLLTTIETVEHQPKLKFLMFDKERPVVVHSKKMDSLIMPALYEEEKIDLKRDYGDSMLYSFENFINDYVFNCWKQDDKKKPLSWLD